MLRILFIYYSSAINTIVPTKVSKTKELIVYYRKGGGGHGPFHIDRAEV